jgi:hypothetical protein
LAPNHIHCTLLHFVLFFVFRKPLRVAVVAAVLVFTISNLVCALVVRYKEDNTHTSPMYLNIVRVSVNDTVFIFAAVALSVCIIKMTKMSSSSLVLEAKVCSL